MGKMIDKATQNAMSRIARCQQNYAAFSFIVRSLPERVHNENMDAITALSLCLHKETLAAWEQLAWLAPISKPAFDLLGERTRSWFARDDTGVMGLLGYDGSYYTADKVAFLAEVRAIFGVEETANEEPQKTLVNPDRTEITRTDNGDGTTSICFTSWEKTIDGCTWLTAEIDEGLQLTGAADVVFQWCFEHCNNAYDALLLQAYIMENRKTA
jgi:hypothetical protein